jgi:cytochrome c-type biogenesis protein CcsB
MIVLENISLIGSPILIVLSLIFSTIVFLQRRKKQIKGQKSSLERTETMNVRSGRAMDISATICILIALLLVTVTILSRAIQTGRGPFSNMYEFAIVFGWGIIVIGLIYRWNYKTAAIQNIGLIVALLLLIFAIFQYSKPASLIPALQQSTLLSAHVASAVVAYGTLTIGFSAAILLLIQNQRNSSWLPDAEVLDAISYNSVIVGFPFLTLLIVLGALWADIAWGTYWSWDPKETASLFTWLIYAGYMHARVVKGWKGNKTAILLIVGFAAILLTFFGNYIFSGLHSY